MFLKNIFKIKIIFKKNKVFDKIITLIKCWKKSLVIVPFRQELNRSLKNVFKKNILIKNTSNKNAFKHIKDIL